MPAWSPGGRFIVYASPAGLVVVGRDGRELARLDTGVTDTSFASWSRERQRHDRRTQTIRT